MNVEHLLDVFTVIDKDSDGTWEACSDFMKHLYWHKRRLVALKSKIEGLPDDRHFKRSCLFWLSRLFDSVGNVAERKRFLIHTLKLDREWGSDHRIAWTLMELSDVNRQTGFYEEGIQQVEEALEIHRRHGDTVGQAQCLISLAWLLGLEKRFDAAEEAAFRAIDLLPEKGQQFRVYNCHRALGEIYRFKGEIGKAVHHYELALGIASSFNWHHDLFLVHYDLAEMFRNEGRLDDAQVHVEHARSHAADDNNAYSLGHAMREQALVWYKQHKLEEAKSEALRAAQVYEKLGADKSIEICTELLRDIEKELDTPVASGQPGFNCELL